jgi:anti-sigma B factor antagonist
MSNDAIVPGFDDEKDDSFKIQLRKIEVLEGGLLLSLTGSIDSYNGECFVRRVTRAVNAEYVQLVFDMQQYKSCPPLVLARSLPSGKL